MAEHHCLRSNQQSHEFRRHRIPDSGRHSAPREIRRFLPRFWIRATSAANDPEETQNIQGVFFNSVVAAQALSIENEIVGSSSGLPGQSFSKFKNNPLQPGEQVIVIEPEAPSGEELAAVQASGGADAVPRRAPMP